MKKNRNNRHVGYNHRDFYRDNILHGKGKLEETEKMKDITFGTNDSEDINSLEIKEKGKNKRKESLGFIITTYLKDNKNNIIFRFITVVVLGGLGYLFLGHFSHNTDIALINKDIEYIGEKLEDLKGNKKISDEDYNSINSKLIQIENQIEVSKKDIEIINKDIDYIKAEINEKIK